MFVTSRYGTRLALVSPLDGLAGARFSAHMVQHVVLMLVAAPLLVSSMPVTVSTFSLPPSARRSIGRWWARAGVIRRTWELVDNSPHA